MGRPRAQIDPLKVEAIAAIGCPPNEIAAELGCGEMTIHRRFGTVVKKGHEKCKTRIRSKLFKEAMGGNMAALIFLAKAVCGLREHDPATNITVTASANANGEPALPTPAEMRARLVAARQILEQNNYGLPREQKDRSNGDSLPNV
jgi:hypothetical protein